MIYIFTVTNKLISMKNYSGHNCQYGGQWQQSKRLIYVRVQILLKTLHFSRPVATPTGAAYFKFKTNIQHNLNQLSPRTQTFITNMVLNSNFNKFKSKGLILTADC